MSKITPIDIKLAVFELLSASKSVSIFMFFFLDMALIRFVILDDDFIGDEFIGQYTIAYSCLLPGYRILKLHGIFGEELEGASLLVHIQSSSAREMGKKKTMLRRRPNRSTG